MSTIETINKDNIQERKKKHLYWLLDSSEIFSNTQHYYFPSVHLNPKAIIDLNLNEVTTKVDLLGHTLSMPFFIAGMTGGSERSYQINHDLAYVAQKMKIALGLGSFRTLFFNKAERIKDFQLRQIAPTIPLFSNLGIGQLLELDHKEIYDLNLELGMSAQFIHFNLGQEIIQKYGDRNFTHVLNILEKFKQDSPIPIWVKETGCGFRIKEIKTLLDMGIEYVDLSGSGGTNWIALEAKNNQKSSLWYEEFLEWGHPTALILAAFHRIFPSYKNRVWSSGGLMRPLDCVKSVAMGAYMAGMARNILLILDKKGPDYLIDVLTDYQQIFHNMLWLCNCRNWNELQVKKSFWYEANFERLINSYIESEKY